MTDKTREEEDIFTDNDREETINNIQSIDGWIKFRDENNAIDICNITDDFEVCWIKKILKQVWKAIPCELPYYKEEVKKNLVSALAYIEGCWNYLYDSEYDKPEYFSKMRTLARNGRLVNKLNATEPSHASADVSAEKDLSAEFQQKLEAANARIAKLEQALKEAEEKLAEYENDELNEIALPGKLTTSQVLHLVHCAELCNANSNKHQNARVWAALLSLLTTASYNTLRANFHTYKLTDKSKKKVEELYKARLKEVQTSNMKNPKQESEK